MRFPMPFKEALRRIIGGRTRAYRLALFREYWRWELRAVAKSNGKDFQPHGPDDSTDAWVAKLSKEGMPEEWFRSIHDFWPAWKDVRKIFNVRKQRQGAINSRWKKYHQKRLLRVLEQRIVILRKGEASAPYAKRPQK